jgi:hypothetical protein
MVIRLALCLNVLLVVLASPVAAQSVLRVLSADAHAVQCKAGVCATIQVSRSTLSDGTSETILFFSVYDEFGEPLPSPFPFPFNPIDNELFTINDEDNAASLRHPKAAVTWRADGSYTEASDFRTRVRDNTQVPPQAYRLVERLRVHGTQTQGTIGDITFDTSVMTPGDGFASGTLAIRRTFRRDFEIPDAPPSEPTESLLP